MAPTRLHGRSRTRRATACGHAHPRAAPVTTAAAGHVRSRTTAYSRARPPQGCAEPRPSAHGRMQPRTARHDRVQPDKTTHSHVRLRATAYGQARPDSASRSRIRSRTTACGHTRPGTAGDAACAAGHSCPVPGTAARTRYGRPGGPAPSTGVPPSPGDGSGGPGRVGGMRVQDPAGVRRLLRGGWRRGEPPHVLRPRHHPGSQPGAGEGGCQWWGGHDN